MRVLVAFDKFKDSISATVAAQAVEGTLRRLHPNWTVDLCPLADGGEGFGSILTAQAGGTTTTLTVEGPRGAKTATSFGQVPVARIPPGALGLLGLTDAKGTHVAVVEMAGASGLALLAQADRDPRETTSFGTGQVLLAAAATRPAALLLGVGGSATNDLGLGALAALGLRLEDRMGLDLRLLPPRRWPEVAGFGGDPRRDLPPLLIACDVENPLLGPTGALATYGPQKGLRPEDYDGFESECARLAALLCRHFGQDEKLMRQPGAGAAGGIAFGLMAAAEARLLPGIELMDAWLDLDLRIAEADMVITGEGRFDSTSLAGKGPGAVARRALALGKVVHVFAGQVRLADQIPGLQTHEITPAEMPLTSALSQAEVLLAASAAAVWPSS